MWIAGGADVRAMWRRAGSAGDVVVEVRMLGDAGGGEVRGGARRCAEVHGAWEDTFGPPTPLDPKHLPAGFGEVHLLRRG